jgi:hypothetical protein
MSLAWNRASERARLWSRIAPQRVEISYLNRQSGAIASLDSSSGGIHAGERLPENVIKLRVQKQNVLQRKKGSGDYLLSP